MINSPFGSNFNGGMEAVYNLSGCGMEEGDEEKKK